MKKIILASLTALLSIAFLPNELKAGPDSLRIKTVLPSAESQILIDRLEEIKGIDKSNLSKIEKRALRKEVKLIDKKLREFSGGIYISVGSLIIILILLIILF